MKVKLLVALSLSLFAITVTSIVTAGLIVYELKKQQVLMSNIPSSNNLNPVGMTADTNATDPTRINETVAYLDEVEVSKHNNAQDCWMTISGNVYNVSLFLDQHPGGKGTVIPYCGKESTSSFQTKGLTPARAHTALAVGLLNNYYVGKLGSPLGTAKPVAKVNVKPSALPQPSTGSPFNQETVVEVPTQQPAPSPSTNISLTAAEVGTHNTLQNCWLIISGKVYDVTRYISNHPGGVSAITNTCGTDATQAFQSKGGKGSNHSSGAYSQLNGYLIGTLGSSVNIVNPAPTNAAGNTTPTVTVSNSNTNSLPSAVQTKYPNATVLKQDYEDDGRQEIKLNFNGECRSIKTNSSGSITEDKSC